MSTKMPIAHCFFTSAQAIPALPVASPAQENRTTRNPARNASDTAFFTAALVLASRFLDNSIAASSISLDRICCATSGASDIRCPQIGYKPIQWSNVAANGTLGGCQ
jgi:hypothetical protein